MTTLGILVVTVCSSLLLAVMDTFVYRESLGATLYRQSFGYYDNWKTYLLLAASLSAGLLADIQGSKQRENRVKRVGSRR
ncbi:hypothetical protein [Paenibacillus hexagrammi]|uniref:CASP-like protein n=1 Tax=Paenibacillus hexagrammi TaxID=2908839 RepID=A0ABY3SLX6_9BACL|nr:hypothetical protein [Paenibacillus sp. YPD9-1]UJF33957.1 hypothetical protein L0M14_01530 [Paenibacillus sp. YPD9-1]